MDKTFFKDVAAKLEVSYEKFFIDLSTTKSYSAICRSDSFYFVFKQIILSLIHGKEVILLDSDLSDEEVSKLLGKNHLEDYPIGDIEEIEIIEFSDIQKYINVNKETWRITLFTSGTTGLPKKISHTFNSITRSVKTGNARVNDIWGFAYNPTHMAGLQVFFQAFLNHNTIIRLFGLGRSMITEQINDCSITNLSATPTFYRMLLPVDHICSSVRGMTTGGEKFDSKTLNILQSMFPNAKIRNVYASTEAGSLFSSVGDLFTLSSDFANLIRIDNNEIFLHKSLLGESAGIKLINDWYATGDLIEIYSQDPFTFKFTSRKNEMINTGGYKVNPQEVEESIRSFHGVKDVYVFGKKNSLLGNVVCCEIVKSDIFMDEKEIRDFLKDKLQEYKIPRFIKFVEKLSVTRTGKLSRRVN